MPISSGSSRHGEAHKTCRLWTWRHVASHPGQTHQEIAEATNEWDATQVLAALFVLIGSGRIEFRDNGYTALEEAPDDL